MNYISKIKNMFDFNHGASLLGNGDARYVDLRRRIRVAHCAGLGGMANFENELARRPHCKIAILEPSPIGIETAAKLNFEPPIEFYQLGLASRTGDVGFDGPDDPNEMSHKPGRDHLFPCVTVSDLARRRHETRIDLLKMNIEGFEYSVLREVLRSGFSIDQICVSFHDTFQGIPTFRTIEAIIDLYLHGFRAIAKKRRAWTFTKRSDQLENSDTVSDDRRSPRRRHGRVQSAHPYEQNGAKSELKSFRRRPWRTFSKSDLLQKSTTTRKNEDDC